MFLCYSQVAGGKYIILEGFTNNKDEIRKWVSESKKYGLEHLEMSMEFCWGIHTKKGQPVEDYNYELPEHLIAQTPLEKRDESRWT